MLKNYRLRLKANTTVDDPAWAASQIDPNHLHITVAGTTTAGSYDVEIVPEDEDVEGFSFEFTRVAEADTAIAAALAAAANVAAASAPGNNFLKADSSNAAGVLALSIKPGAPTFTVVLTPPGSATMTPDHTGVLPIMARATSGKGALSISCVATDGGIPVANGSGTVDMQLVSVVDRSEPRGKGGVELTLAAVVQLDDSVDNQALGAAWVTEAPAGYFTVRISSDVSLPAGTDGLEVWVSEIDAPPPPPSVTVQTGVDVSEYTLDIAFSDLGSGASDLIAAADFPLRTRILDAWLVVRTAAAGEADLACVIGVTADDNGYMTTQNLNAVAAGTILASNAALASGLYYADAETSGLGVTFTATELDDVSAGEWTLHVRHMPLS